MEPSPHRRSERRRAASSAGRWVLAAAVAGSALAVGTVHTATLCVVTAALAVAMLLLWWGGEPVRMRPVASGLVLTGVALTAFTALQCVPMPVELLGAIAPHNAAVWARALSPLREPGPAWAPLSLDPMATRVEVLKGVAYLLTLVAALRVARDKRGVGFLGAVVVVTAVVLAAAALAHPAFGMRRLFGVFEPAGIIADRHIAPLMNANQLAGYVNIGFCLALAAALSQTPPVPRALSIGVGVFLAGVQVWIASRGGVLGMVVGAVLVGVLTRAAHGRHPNAVRLASALAGLAAAAGAVMIALGSSDDVKSEIFTADVSKLDIAWQALGMLRSFGGLGVGRGAFESTYPAFRLDPPGYQTFTNPENVIPQWTVEWGVPVAVAAFAAIAIALRPTAALARSTSATGAWAGVAAFALQSLGDFGTEVPGIVIAVTVCAATIAGGSPGRVSRWPGAAWSRHSRVVAVVGAAMTCAALALAWPALTEGLHEDQHTAYDATVRHPQSAEEVVALEREMMLRHPAEPYLPFIAGLQAAGRHDRRAVAWLGAAMERAPLYGPAHLVLARVLAGASPAQARFEYRTAIAQAPEFAYAVVPEMARLVLQYWDALEVVPEGQPGEYVLTGLVPLVEPRLPATAVRLDVELARRAPSSPGPALRTARGAVLDVEGGAEVTWCGARSTCREDALAAVGRAQRLDPMSCEPFTLEARIRIATGDAAAGLLAAERATEGVRDRTLCYQELFWLAHGARLDREASEVVSRVASAGCVDDAECTKNLAWAGGAEAALGNRMQALAFYKRAYERATDRGALLESMAGLAAAAGLHAEAEGYFTQLASLHPADLHWAQAASDEHVAALRGALKL